MNFHIMKNVTILPPNYIFVFGSNRQGIHKRGAAKDALDYFGAILGQGEGFQGQSYALPTKATPWVSLSLPEIQKHVEVFLWTARHNIGCKFIVTPVGCGLAGYNHEDIAPMFKEAPDNCLLPQEWSDFV